MSDLPENLQIKLENSPPSAPGEKSAENIKAKLNLHVKRRLQDCNQSENAKITSTSTQVLLGDTKQDPRKSESIRQKRPYHKRTDKNKTVQSLDNTSVASPTIEANIIQRKYKQQIKRIVINEKQDILTTNSIGENLGANHYPVTTDTISAGDDDEGVHDDLKAAREKEKCPDILGMVLGMKKRALLQDPEVQVFLKEVMDIIKC